jgi:hypothetical protein
MTYDDTTSETANGDETNGDHADGGTVSTGTGRPGIAPGVSEGGSPPLPDETSYDIHAHDPGEAVEPRTPQQTAAELAADPDQQGVGVGRGPHERGAGVRSPGGGDDAVAGDEV